MKKAVLAVLTAGAVLAAALVPSGPPVAAASRGFGSALSAVHQPVWQTDGSVNALAVAGPTVFAGGLFESIRPPGADPEALGERRWGLAAFDRATGQPRAFAPRLNGPVWSLAVSPDGRWLAVGGDFTQVDGQPRSKVAMFEAATGRLVAGWRPAVSFRVAALKIRGNTVYLGGSFGKVSGTARNRLAAVTLNTGAVLPWNPDANDDVHAIELSADGSRVFVGGAFTQLKGGPRHALAMVDPASGAPYPMPAAAAIPAVTGGCDSRVKDLEVAGGKVFVANAGSGRGCYDGIIAADARTGKLVWQSHCLGSTEALSVVGGWLYKGSHAHDCSQDGSFGPGAGVRFLLVHNAATGKFGPWFPNTNTGGETRVGPLAFASGGNDLWVGGDFTRADGVPQQGLTRFTNVPGGTAPAGPAAPKVISTRAGTATVTFPAVVDRDDITLTYTLYRGTTRIGTWSRASYPWTRPVITHTDTALPSGRSTTYHVEATDGRNLTRGPSTTITIR